MLAKFDSSLVKPEAGLEEIVALVTKDLTRIVGSYNRLLDEYLNAIVTSVVTLKEGPCITREGPSIAILGAALLSVSAILPFLIVLFEKAFRED
jgi:ABC-type enterochelin transport system permease subunit